MIVTKPLTPAFDLPIISLLNTGYDVSTSGISSLFAISFSRELPKITSGLLPLMMSFISFSVNVDSNK